MSAGRGEPVPALAWRPRQHWGLLPAPESGASKESRDDMVSCALQGGACPTRLPSCADAASGGHVRGGALGGAPLECRARDSTDSRGDFRSRGRVSHVDCQRGCGRCARGSIVGAPGGAAFLAGGRGAARPGPAWGFGRGRGEELAGVLSAAVGICPAVPVSHTRTGVGVTEVCARGCRVVEPRLQAAAAALGFGQGRGATGPILVPKGVRSSVRRWGAGGTRCKPVSGVRGAYRLSLAPSSRT